MKRAYNSVSRNKDWNAWDANTSVYRRPASVRVLLRRLAKRQDRNIARKEINEQVEEMECYNMNSSHPHIRAHIRLNSQGDAMNLVQALNDEPDEFFIENASGALRANAKSIIGVMYAMFDYNDDTYIVNATANGVFPRVVDTYRA